MKPISSILCVALSMLSCTSKNNYEAVPGAGKTADPIDYANNLPGYKWNKQVDVYTY